MHKKLSVSLSSVLWWPQEHTLGGNLVSPAELAALRDEFIPQWICLEDAQDRLFSVAKRLVETVVHAPIQETDYPLRNEIVLMALWIQRLGEKGPPDLALHHEKKRRVPDFQAVVDAHDMPMDDVKSSEVCKHFLLRPQANTNERVYRLALGRTLASFSWNEVSLYKINLVQVPYGHEAELCDTVVNMLKRASLTCQFDRIRDLYMHQLLRGKLSPARLATLSWNPSTPFEELPLQYPGKATNDLVRPFIETSAEKVCCAVDWKSVASPEVFVLVMSMLQETLDHVAECTPVFNSTEIPFHKNIKGPCPVVLHPDFRPDAFLGSFGFVHNKEFYVLESKTEYPIPALIICWLELCEDVFSKETAPHAKALSELRSAILDPDSLLPSHHLYRFFNDAPLENSKATK